MNRQTFFAWSSLGLICLALVACAPEKPQEAKPAASLFAPKPPRDATLASKTADTAKPTSPTKPSISFTDASDAWGIRWTHHAGRSPEKWVPEVMSGGVALVDVDRNGALDLLLVDAGSLTANPATTPQTRLFLGDGHGGFQDATEAFELRHPGYAMGVAAGDIDNDGWVDIYLTTYDGHDRLLRNDGGKRFVDVTEASGIAPSGWSTSAAMFDLEGDGDLDLYVVKYVDYDVKTALKCYHSIIHILCSADMYEPLPDQLYRNDGGRFVDISEEVGLTKHAAKGLALATGDLDRDGDTDLYVADDISRNLLLLNQGNAQLAEVGVIRGVAYSELGREEASMGVAVADSDDDGQWDLAVTNFQAEPTSLYARRSHGGYRERSDAAGVGASSRARLSFGIAFFDADNDGDEDLLTANGHISDNVASYRQRVTFGQQNSLYARVAPGKFVDISDQSGPALAHQGVSRGLAIGDLDSDGGLDFVVVDNNAAVQVARNTSPERGHWINLWLEGREANRSAIGASVTVQVGGRTLVREVRGADSYLSVSDRRLHFGLGEVAELQDIVVTWPGGQQQHLGPQAA
ncbi:MAG: CRTAC1 family protein, partial [Nannocystaceae bacterium]